MSHAQRIDVIAMVTLAVALGWGLGPVALVVYGLVLLVLASTR